jgi:hypothetical protein
MKDLWLITYLSCQDVSICKLACYVHRPQWFLITEVLRARHAFSKWFTFSTHLPKLDPSKELSVCDYKRKINSRINHLIDCGTSPWRFYLSWNSQRMYLACEAHGVPLQSSNLISIGGAHHSNILGVNQGFFLFFLLFFLYQVIGKFFAKINHKLIQIHTRKSKVWNYISERKKHWCWPSALSMYSTNLQSFS